MYLRGQEGQGIGLLAKLAAYALQDLGADTADANFALGLPIDNRCYDQASAILHDLGIHAVRLLSGNPAKEEALTTFGVTVKERRGLVVTERYEPKLPRYKTSIHESRCCASDSRLTGIDPPVDSARLQDFSVVPISRFRTGCHEDDEHGTQ